MNQRRYRGAQSRAIPVWNGVLEHRQRIDSAIWVFLWCLDAITEEKDGVGLIHGGAPVKIRTIAEALGFDGWTVRHHLHRLTQGGYIRRRRTPYGYVLTVANSRKFGIWHAHERSGENPQSQDKRSGVLQRESVGKPTERVWENPRNKEDAAVDAVKRRSSTQAASKSDPESSVWSFLGINPCGPLPFRALLESRWASRNGGPYSILIGETVDAWEDADGKLRGAPKLFAALASLREQEKHTSRKPIEEPIHTFSSEEIPQ